MKLFNPHTEKVEMVFKGTAFAIEAGKVSEELKPEVAFHWMEKIHQFLEVAKKEEVVVPVTTPETPVVTEKPKVVAKKAVAKKKVVNKKK